MQKRWGGSVIVLAVVANYVSCASQKCVTKDVYNNIPIINDTIQTDAWNGRWLTLLDTNFYVLYPVCMELQSYSGCDSVILDVQGSKVSLYALSEPQFNYIGVFKLEDKMQISYFYMPMDVAKFRDRYRGYEEGFLRKYHYLINHNANNSNTHFRKCQCSLWLSSKLIKAKSYRKNVDRLILSLQDSSEILFSRFTD